MAIPDNWAEGLIPDVSLSEWDKLRKTEVGERAWKVDGDLAVLTDLAGKEIYRLERWPEKGNEAATLANIESLHKRARERDKLIEEARKAIGAVSQ